MFAFTGSSSIFYLIIFKWQCVSGAQKIFFMHGCIRYLKLPLDLVDPGLGLDLALEVDVIFLLDVGGVQGGAELE